jgi:glycosyltransferase involved in cell wall biosynthesis
MDQSQLPDVYRQGTVFVLPALEEAMPNAVLEAMAAGLPIVTTDTGARELVDGNGFVVKQGHAAALRQALSRYVEDPELCVDHGARSRTLAESMSWEAAAEAYHEIYRRVLQAVAPG